MSREARFVVPILAGMLITSGGVQEPRWRLPEPQGAFAVGTRWHTFDATTTDFSGRVVSRPMAAQIWYPTAPWTGDSVAYWPRAEEGAGLTAELMRWPSQLIADFAGVRTAARAGAPVRQARSPLLIFAHGYSMWVGQNSALMIEAASRGWIVVSVAFADETAYQIRAGGRIAAVSLRDSIPAGRWREILDGGANQLYAERIAERREEQATRLELEFLGKQPLLNESARVWSRDIRLWMDEMLRQSTEVSSPFAGRIDGSRIALVGHSFGGSAAVLAAHQDPRVITAVNLDGTQYGVTPGTKLRAPVLFVSNVAKGSNINALYYESAPAGSLALALKEAGHLDFSDATVFAKRLGNPRLFGSIAADTAILVVNELVMRYLNYHVSGGPAPETWLRTQTHLTYWARDDKVPAH